MTALWFLVVATWVLGGLGLLWKVAAVVLEVLREPLPASLGTGPRHTGHVPADDAWDEGVDLFARSRAAALAARPDPLGYVEGRGSTVAETRNRTGSSPGASARSRVSST